MLLPFRSLLSMEVHSQKVTSGLYCTLPQRHPKTSLNRRDFSGQTNICKTHNTSSSSSSSSSSCPGLKDLNSDMISFVLDSLSSVMAQICCINVFTFPHSPALLNQQKNQPVALQITRMSPQCRQNSSMPSVCFVS